jgi:hypothetical protein
MPDTGCQIPDVPVSGIWCLVSESAAVGERSESYAFFNWNAATISISPKKTV